MASSVSYICHCLTSKENGPDFLLFLPIQREVNDLLQRKNNWLESDVSRFTELVRQDHLNEHRERDSKIEVTREEETVERKIGEMMQAILRRYHEEQVWSDKVGYYCCTSMPIIETDILAQNRSDLSQLMALWLSHASTSSFSCWL